MKNLLTLFIVSLFVFISPKIQASDGDRLILGMHYSMGMMDRIYELNRDGELWGQTFQKGEPVVEKRVLKRFEPGKAAEYFELARKHMEVKLDTKGSLTKSWEIHLDGKVHRFNWSHPSFNAAAADMMSLHREILEGL